MAPTLSQIARDSDWVANSDYRQGQHLSTGFHPFVTKERRLTDFIDSRGSRSSRLRMLSFVRENGWLAPESSRFSRF